MGAYRDTCLTYIKELTIGCGNSLSRISIACSDEVAAPPRGSLPIEGLSLQKGWECDRCEYVSVKEGSMREDCRREHQWMKAQCQYWQQQHVQTFFPSVNRKYFVVTPIVERRELESSGIMVDDCIKALLDEAEGMDAGRTSKWD